MLLTSVLLWFHIFAAAGWLGATMIFALLIGPTIGTFTPGTKAEAVLKLFPKYIRYIWSFSIATVVFGVALVFAIGDGSMSVLSPSTPFGLYISVGALLAIITVVLAFGFILPSARRMVWLTEQMVKNQGIPSPDLPRAAARLRFGSLLGLTLLVLVLVFMVAGTTD